MCAVSAAKVLWRNLEPKKESCGGPVQCHAVRMQTSSTHVLLLFGCPAPLVPHFRYYESYLENLT